MSNSTFHPFKVLSHLLASAAFACLLFCSCSDSKYDSKLYKVQHRVLNVYARVLKRPVDSLAPTADLLSIGINDTKPAKAQALKKALEDEFKVTVPDELLIQKAHVYDTIDYIGEKCYGLETPNAHKPDPDGPWAPGKKIPGEESVSSTTTGGATTQGNPSAATTQGSPNAATNQVSPSAATTQGSPSAATTQGSPSAATTQASPSATTTQGSPSAATTKVSSSASASTSNGSTGNGPTNSANTNRGPTTNSTTSTGPTTD